jgi:flavin-dependent dehydrogenase
VLSGRGQFVQYTGGRPQVHEQPLLTSSRPLLESRIRARVLALPNVATRRSQVTGLEYRDGRVSAVRHRSSDADHLLPADFVVDAMGRGSRLADWLDADPAAPSRRSKTPAPSSRRASAKPPRTR